MNFPNLNKLDQINIENKKVIYLDKSYNLVGYLRQEKLVCFGNWDFNSLNDCIIAREDNCKIINVK